MMKLCVSQRKRDFNFADSFIISLNIRQKYRELVGKIKKRLRLRRKRRINMYYIYYITSKSNKGERETQREMRGWDEDK